MIPQHFRGLSPRALLLCLTAFAVVNASRGSAQTPALRVEQVHADTTAFAAVATLIIGPRHALLWDAQYHRADAERVADAVARSGKSLQAIIISHPDEDHYSGLASIIARFPGTPVYMTQAGLAVFDAMAPARFKSDRATSPSLFADSLVRPTVLLSDRILLDGAELEVIPDLQGDVLAPTNSALWIPSIRTLLAGDIVFRGVYPWFGASDSASRAAWRGSIRGLAALRPAVVIAGHKAKSELADTPAVLDSMDRYLATFDSIRQSSPGAAQLRDAMLARYPEYRVRMLLIASAGAAFRHRAPATTAGGSPATTSAPTDTLFRLGEWTGTLTTPGGTMAAGFGFGRKEGKLSLLIRPDGPPPIEASDVRYDGKTLRFTFAAGPRRVHCTLTVAEARGFEGSCGEEAGQPGPFEVKITAPPVPGGE